MADDSNRQAGAEIEVTKEMLDAGLEVLCEHTYGGDARYMVECIYRQMAYAFDRASSIRVA